MAVHESNDEFGIGGRPRLEQHYGTGYTGEERAKMRDPGGPEGDAERQARIEKANAPDAERQGVYREELPEPRGGLPVSLGLHVPREGGGFRYMQIPPRSVQGQ